MIDVVGVIKEGLEIKGRKRVYCNKFDKVKFEYEFKNDTPFRIKLGAEIGLITIRDDDKIEIGWWGKDFVWLDEFTRGKFWVMPKLAPYFRRYVFVVKFNVLEPVNIEEFDVWTTDVFAKEVENSEGSDGNS